MALSDDAIKQLTVFIETEATAWVKEYIANRRAFLQKRKIDTSGRLAESMGYEIATALGAEVKTTLQQSFEDYGRYIDMRRLKPPEGGGDYIAAIEEWIVRKGFEQKFIAAFMRRRRLKTVPQKVLNSIAWGIAKNRSAKYRRRSAWYSKSKSAALTDLYNRVASGLPDIVVAELKKAFKH